MKTTVQPKTIADLVQRYFETATGCKVDVNSTQTVVTVYFLLSEFTKIRNMSGLTFEFFAKSYDYSLEKDTLEMVMTLDNESIQAFVEYWNCKFCASNLFTFLSDEKLKWAQEFNANVGRRV